MRWLLVLMLVTSSCASSAPAPLRLNPLEGATVFELDVDDWHEVCLRIAPPQVHRYQCVTVGELRKLLDAARLRAN